MTLLDDIRPGDIITGASGKWLAVIERHDLRNLPGFRRGPGLVLDCVSEEDTRVAVLGPRSAKSFKVVS